MITAVSNNVKPDQIVTLKQEVREQSYSKTVKPAAPDKIRRMRRDPTIALCRQLFLAAHWLAAWSYEKLNDDVPDEWAEFVEANVQPFRMHLINSGPLGCFDFGWQPYELAWEIKNSLLKLTQVKSLIQEQTEIIEDDLTGVYQGLRQEFDLPIEKTLLLNYDQEGTMYEGQSIMENCHWPYDASFAVNDAAERFDRKMAGSHWVIQYPQTKVQYKGEERDASEIVDDIFKYLQSSGFIAVPLGGSTIDDLENQGWKIELHTASGSAFPFDQRFRYLDALKVRGAGFTERSILEGQYGTKAEADTHADFTITLIEYRHAAMIDHINRQLVNRMLNYQFGEGTEFMVYIKPAPLNNADRAALRQLYDKLLSSPDGMLQELDDIDTRAIRDQLGVPSAEEEEGVLPDDEPEPEPVGDPTEGV